MLCLECWEREFTDKRSTKVAARGRLGGDEFGVLLCDADEEFTQTIIDRIEAALAADNEPGLPGIKLAIGASTSRDKNLDAAQQRADALMLESKRHLRSVA